MCGALVQQNPSTARLKSRTSKSEGLRSGWVLGRWQRSPPTRGPRESCKFPDEVSSIKTQPPNVLIWVFLYFQITFPATENCTWNAQGSLIVMLQEPIIFWPHFVLPRSGLSVARRLQFIELLNPQFLRRCLQPLCTVKWHTRYSCQPCGTFTPILTSLHLFFLQVGACK